MFIVDALEKSGILIDLLAEWHMHMSLPRGIPTFQHMVTKKYLKTNNIFWTDNLRLPVILCNTAPQLCPTKMDHVPVATILELSQSRNKPNH